VVWDDPLWDAIEPWMIEIRRDLHRHPELRMATERTTRVVERELDAMGIAHRRLAGTGVQAWIGPDTGEALLLRADMDALPIEEQTDVDYRSTIPGRMHACGHDCHTAMLLGAARYLNTHVKDLRRRVVLMFQPGEEGPGGALPMIEEGVLTEPPVAQACMVHIRSDVPAGVVGVATGPAMAASDGFSVVVRGRGGHAMAPHLGVDALYAAGAIIVSAQSLVSRETDPFDSVVVGFTRIAGGERASVVVDRVELHGTIRTVRPETRAWIVDRLPHLIRSVAEAHRATAEVEVETDGYPPLVADVDWGTEARRRVAAALPPAAVRSIAPIMGAEDFAFVAERIPATVLWVGVAGPHTTTGLHSSGLVVDERALRYGAAALAAIAQG
jgi:amidohydrolase